MNRTKLTWFGHALVILSAAWLAMLALGSLGVPVRFVPVAVLAFAMWLVA